MRWIYQSYGNDRVPACRPMRTVSRKCDNVSHYGILPLFRIFFSMDTLVDTQYFYIVCQVLELSREPRYTVFNAIWR